MSTASWAGINPFKKDINLEFGAAIQWEINKTSLVKSGVTEQRNGPRYYHLNINNQQLLLRLAMNKANIQAQDTVALERLDLLDIFTNGQRLPVFQWCMNNRINAGSYKALSKDTQVRDNICHINIDKGEITIKLDNESRNLLAQARNLSIDIRLGKYVSHLTYNMQGFSQQLASLNSNKIRLAKTQNPSPVQSDPTRFAPTKPNPVKRPTEQAMPLKTATITPATKLCYIRPSDPFSKKIKPISYPCNNRRLKRQAQKTIHDQTSQQKFALQNEQRRLKDKEELRLAKIENHRLQKINKEIEIEAAQRELEWKKMKTSLWVGRCIKHWNKGTSPCYCQAYLERAPKNTKNTCKKHNYNQLTQE